MGATPWVLKSAGCCRRLGCLLRFRSRVIYEDDRLQGLEHGPQIIIQEPIHGLVPKIELVVGDLAQSEQTTTGTQIHPIRLTM